MNTSRATPQSSSLASRLIKFRLSLGYSKSDLAARLGVTSMTLHRWESGATKPSPLAAQKLAELGFGEVAPSETNASSVPKLRQSTNLPGIEASRLRKQGAAKYNVQSQTIEILPAPFVRNGPPDQADFHSRLLQLQLESPIQLDELAPRMSLVQEVAGMGAPWQCRLEKPRPTAVSWNSNYGSHGWHRYVGRFPPHVVRSILNHVGADASTTVCDPFSGSGTTAVECRLLGIPFVGIEICPLSAMMTRVKAAYPQSPEPLLGLAKKFVEFYELKWSEEQRAKRRSKDPLTHVLTRPSNPILRFANIEKWFTPEALLGTSITVEFAMQYEGFQREVVLLALSAKMRSIGNVDVDVVRAEYSKKPRENVDVGGLVARQLTKMAEDIRQSAQSHPLSGHSKATISVYEASVLDVDLPENSISHVITSPPYGVEAISYLRTHLLSYRALVAHLNHDPYDTRDKTIGSEFVIEAAQDAGQRSAKASKTCRSFFAACKAVGDKKFDQRRAAMLQFCDDMLSVGDRLARWVKTGGTVTFVIGNKRLGDHTIPLDAIVSELFEARGFKRETSIRHKLKTNNSNSQVPWQDRIIQDESILIFRNLQ